MDFSSLMTYTYKEDEPMKHAASGLITAVLFLDFIGGYFSGILGWWWPIIVVSVWTFWRNREFLGSAIKVKTYDEMLRNAVSFIIMLIFAFVFFVGLYAGPRGWWWISLPLIFVHISLVKVVQEPYSGGH